MSSIYIIIMKNKKGGNVIASGGYGCVFNPALKCQGDTKRAKGKITKLMTEKHATEEYEDIVSIKEKLDKIKNYKNFYLIYDINLCKPNKLTKDDLKAFKKCKALPKDNITRKNINSKLDEVMSLNIPNGGLPVDDYIYSDGSFEKIYKLHLSLINLLKNGIIPMNEKHVYHGDIKDSNVLVDDTSSDLKTRLIDWGLSVEYKPLESSSVPKSWTNRPLQFNVPFSVVIFSEAFIKRYTNFLENGGNLNTEELKPFVIDYINFWMKERGAGHYKFINEIMYSLFSNSLTTITTENKPAIIETQITMEFIVNYIVNILVHFDKFRENGMLNLKDYLDTVFIKIADIWGFINVYFPLLELLHNNYKNLSENELKIFNQLKFIFVEYLYKPRHEPIDMKKLYLDFDYLGNLIYINTNNKKNRQTETTKISSKKSSTIKTSLVNAAGIKKKTKKNKSHIIKSNKTSVSFKRRPKQKRFKNPFFLTFNKKKIKIL